MKKIIKKISRSKRLLAVLCWLLSVVIKVIHKTIRWKKVGFENLEKFWDEDKPVLVAIWHGRIMMMPPEWTHEKPIHFLISMHRDGILISKTVKHLGVETIRGSTTRGGTNAARRISKVLKTGCCVGITPDGPKGPRMRDRSSLTYFAKKFDIPIIPVTYSATPVKVFKSWDRFILPMPFSKGILIVGHPMYVPVDADSKTVKDYQKKLEKNLNKITKKADRYTGLKSVKPAELTPRKNKKD